MAHSNQLEQNFSYVLKTNSISVRFDFRKCVDDIIFVISKKIDLGSWSPWKGLSFEPLYKELLFLVYPSYNFIFQILPFCVGGLNIRVKRWLTNSKIRNSTSAGLIAHWVQVHPSQLLFKFPLIWVGGVKFKVRSDEFRNAIYSNVTDYGPA